MQASLGRAVKTLGFGRSIYLVPLDAADVRMVAHLKHDPQVLWWAMWVSVINELEKSYSVYP